MIQSITAHIVEHDESADPPEANGRRPSAVPLPEPLARQLVRLLAGGVEPNLRLDDLAMARNCSRRTIERMWKSRKVPPPDSYVGPSPRWRPATVRAWLDGEPIGNDRQRTRKK